MERSRVANLKRQAVEWPTVGLIAIVYLGWGLTTYFHASLPFWALGPLGAWFIAWHSSTQHEIIHGHPTRNRTVNRLLGAWPLMLWLPYESYRISHLTHHRDERLTDPLDDPESHYWTEEQWAAVGAVRRMIIRANSTFLGRMLIGPAWSMGRFVSREMVSVIRGDRLRRRIWSEHLASAAVVVAWLVLVCDMNLWVYVFAFVYPGTALMLVRSFAEHRAESEVDERTAIVENTPLLGLLFLNNNLHVVHHDRPTMPWYEIPAYYRAHRERLIAENGGLVYDGYWDVVRRYLVTPHDHVIHPFGRAPQPGPVAKLSTATSG